MKVEKQIKARLSFHNAIPETVVSTCQAVIAGMKGNDKFPNPPVNLEVFQTEVTTFAANIVEARDGSKKAIAARDKQGAEVVTMLKLLGHYVEAVSKADMATFMSSGFVPRSTTKAAPQPLSQSTIDKVDQGNTGQMFVSIRHVKGAVTYELHHAPMSGGTPAARTTITVMRTRKPVPVNGLTPGTTYAFQVRALGKLGHTDWSDSVTRMCI